ncbi:MAG: T9SS type A sorting domain-containing protein, partial [Ignavibacteriaceae bacterium]|nr:T9SS type A sorting domain-containing protein [Ignavibacteriaceae bacterium]
PANYSLSQNYPNPFNPSTTIRYGLPFVSNVKIDVYDMIGQKVTSLLDTEQQPGHHEVLFNTDGLTSGIYFYVINSKQVDGTGKFSEVKKMVLMK